MCFSIRDPDRVMVLNKRGDDKQVKERLKRRGRRVGQVMKQNGGFGEELLVGQTLFMKLINCLGAKHHGHQSLQNERRREVRESGRGGGGEKWDREGRSRSEEGGGIEGE